MVAWREATMIRRLFDVLGLDPVDELEPDCWEFLLENETVFQEEFARSRASLQTMRWRSPTMARAAAKDLSCLNCRSELLELEDRDVVDQQIARLKCRACGWTFSAKERIWPTLVQHFGQDLYEAATQGGLPPVFKCEACGEVAVVADEGECAFCGCGSGGYELRCEVRNAILTDKDREQCDRAAERHGASQVKLMLSPSHLPLTPSTPVRAMPPRLTGAGRHGLDTSYAWDARV
jgi:transcription elongation factor Elf1